MLRRSELSTQYSVLSTQYSVLSTVGHQYSYGQIYTNIEKTATEIQVSKHQNPIGRNMVEPRPTSSPSSILPPNSSHCDFIPTREHSARLSQMLQLHYLPDVHEFVHRDTTMKITNNMHLLTYLLTTYSMEQSPY
jgi:hypothetical protein